MSNKYNKNIEVEKFFNHNQKTSKITIQSNYRSKYITKLVDIVCIGTSTGGPAALIKLLSNIQSDFPLPIVIVQHIPLDFIKEFINTLKNISSLPIKLAQDGMVLTKGEIFIAPGNRHTTIIKEELFKVIHLVDTPPVSGHRPSIDVLFSSIAKSYSDRAIAVLLTGMGKDGVKGIGKLFKLGAITIAQDEDSSVVFGMPKAAINSGYIHHVVDIESMAKVITHLAHQYNGL